MSLTVDWVGYEVKSLIGEAICFLWFPVYVCILDIVVVVMFAGVNSAC